MSPWKASFAAAVLVVWAVGCGEEAWRPSAKPHAVRAASQAIQGGTVDTGDPAVVGLLVNTGQGIAVCSGTLIGPNLVLTAHHCISDILTQQLTCNPNTFGPHFANARVVVTTSYNAAAQFFNQGAFPAVNGSTWFGVRAIWSPGNDVCGQDVALLELTTNVQGVCPLMPRVDIPVANNEAYRAVGFGVTSPTGQTAGTRYSVSGLNVLCAGNCGFGTSSTLEWIGGTNQARGTCEGDSGGPSLDGQNRVLGVVSRGPQNACNEAVYESVVGQAAWIRQRALVAAADGNYAAAGWVTGASTSTSQSGYCPNADGGAGGGAGGGMGGGGGGSPGTTCSNPTWQCVDGSGQGDFACVDPNSSTGFPPGAPVCTSSMLCPVGSSCWAQSGAASGLCLEDCVPGGTGGGGGGGAGGGVGGGVGGGAGGGTGGGTASNCANPAFLCVDGTGAGDYACIDPTSATGVPSNAPVCSSSMACPGGFNCWSTSAGSSTGVCLGVCTPGGTGGGAGGGSGGGVGGGAGGGVAGGSGGGVAGGAGGGAAGGVGGGAAGGGVGGAGGGASGGGTGGTDGGLNWVNPYAGGAGGGGGGEPPRTTGCGCAEVPMGTSSLWLALAGLVAARRRRPRFS